MGVAPFVGQPVVYLLERLHRVESAIVVRLKSIETRLEALVEHAVRGNVQRVVQQLLTSNPILNEFVRRGRIRIVGAYYNLHTGQVELL